MTRSRLSSRNLVKAALSSLILIILIAVSGCSSSITPTYDKENTARSIRELCKKEYNIDVITRLEGDTLWVYVPLEDLFERDEKPQKYTERFMISRLDDISQSNTLGFEYTIGSIPDREKTQDYKYNKEKLEKINQVWRILRRVIFSLNRSKGDEPKFYCLIAADIKNGFEASEIFYYLDIKKVSYEYISWGEYQHRAIQESNFSPQIIGDTQGIHINYRDITMKEFIIAQIMHRIKLKFQKPEIDRNMDIDKEITRIVAHVVRIYNFEDFDIVELNDLAANNKLTLSKAALQEKANE